MMRLVKKIGLFTSVMILIGFSAQSFAQTAAGVDVVNTATLNFDVGTVTQTPIPASVTFEVDRVIDLTVTRQDTAPVQVAAGENTGTDETNSTALEFTLLHSGNARQNFILQAATNGQPELAPLTDGTANDFAVTAFRYYLEDGTTPGLDAADTEIAAIAVAGLAGTFPVLTDIDAGAAASTIYVVGQIDGGATASQSAGVTLIAAAAEPTTPLATQAIASAPANGSLITDASATVTAADTNAGIETVLADADADAPAASTVNDAFDFGTTSVVDEEASNAQHSATSAYTVIAAAITVTKSVATLCDNTSLVTNAKAIPGSVQRYTVTVTNSAAATASATLTRLDDIVPANTAITVMRDYAGVSGDGTCAGFPALDGADNEFRAGCTDAAGAAAAAGRATCTDASSDAYTYYAQGGAEAIDSDGTVATSTVTVCYDSQSAVGVGNDCTAAGSVVLEAEGGFAEGELAPDEAVVFEFDVIVQ